MDEKNPSPATTILSHKVKPGHTKYYEQWSKKITAKASTYEGFQNVTRINPEDSTNPEYVVIVQWSSYENLKNGNSQTALNRWSRKARNSQYH